MTESKLEVELPKQEAASNTTRSTPNSPARPPLSSAPPSMSKSKLEIGLPKQEAASNTTRSAPNSPARPPLSPVSPSMTSSITSRRLFSDIKGITRSPRLTLRTIDQSDEIGGTWRKFQDLLVHVPLAQKGVMVAKIKEEMEETSFAAADNFVVGPSRTLFFNQPKKNWPNYNKQAALLKQLEMFAMGKMAEGELKRSCSAFSDEAKFVGKYDVAKLIGEYAAEYAVREDIVYNKRRREEVFLPLLIKSGVKDEDSWDKLYVYPWLSKNNGSLEFAGFKRFVVAVCMFAAGFRGECQNGTSFALIKHFIPFYSDQCVVNVFFEEDLTNNYEAYVFAQLATLSAYIQTHTEDGQPKELFCHMPYFDYILFLIDLFIRGRMKLAVLNKAIEKILDKRDTYAEQIEKFCKERGVTVHIGSPFDPIFDGLERELQELPVESGNNISLAQAFLRRLNVSYKEVSLGTLPKEIETENQKKLVQQCLIMLGDANPVWHQFIRGNKGKISTLEDLFKMANAVMVAISTEGTADYQTLVWELLTEKQIQISYADFSRIIDCPAVVNLTILDPSIIYTKTNNGNVFYQDRHGPARSQSELMKRWSLISQSAAHQDLSVAKVEEILDLKKDGQFRLS